MSEMWGNRDDQIPGLIDSYSEALNLLFEGVEGDETDYAEVTARAGVMTAAMLPVLFKELAQIRMLLERGTG